MVTFRNNNNNNRRSSFRRNGRNDRSYKTGIERGKFSNSFSNSDNFQRKAPGRNNHNAPKLIEKYNNLAREALTGGDKILSENYFQHADHFTRILNEQESYKKIKFSGNTSNLNNSEISNEKKIDTISENENTKPEDSQSETI
tara:strand:+ start:200 stop:628 length:429 start_codon:yes stop_codon:yes gene_type:complete